MGRDDFGGIILLIVQTSIDCIFWSMDLWAVGKRGVTERSQKSAQTFLVHLDLQRKWP